MKFAAHIVVTHGVTQVDGHVLVKVESDDPRVLLHIAEDFENAAQFVTEREDPSTGEKSRECDVASVVIPGLKVVEKRGDDPRTFPLQDGGGRVPWWAAERAYQNYARRYGREQTLERLAQRGGFGVAEFAVLFYDKPVHVHARGGPITGDAPHHSRQPDWDRAGIYILRALREIGDEWEFRQ